MIYSGGQINDCSLTKCIVFTRQHGTVDSWSALQIAREWSAGLAQLRMMMQEKLSLPLLLYHC
jgi:hypothetical protein